MTIRNIVREEINKAIQEVISHINKAPGKSGDVYLNQNQCAEIAGTCRATISKWIASGRLRANRIDGKLIRIKRSDLDIALEASSTNDANMKTTVDDEVSRIINLTVARGSK